MNNNFLEKILFQLGVTLQEAIGLSLMETEDDEESLENVSQALEEANKHFNEAFDISRYYNDTLEINIPNKATLH